MSSGSVKKPNNIKQERKPNKIHWLKWVCTCGHTRRNHWDLNKECEWIDHYDADGNKIQTGDGNFHGFDDMTHPATFEDCECKAFKLDNLWYVQSHAKR